MNLHGLIYLTLGDLCTHILVIEQIAIHGLGVHLFCLPFAAALPAVAAVAAAEDDQQQYDCTDDQHPWW